MARKKKAGRRDNKDGQIVEDGKFFRARLEVGTNPRTGKPVYKTARCKDKTEALEALDKMKADRANGAATPVERGNFGDFLDHWLANTVKPTRSANTYRQYEWLVRFHIKPHLGSKQTDKISRADVQKLIAAKAKQTLTPKDKEKKNETDKTLSGNTVRNIRACLHKAFDEAKRHGLASRNPADSVDLPRKVRDPKKQFLTPEETTKFIGKLGESDLADLFAFMIATGTRLGEATGVRWQDLDFSVPSRPMVWIRGQLQRSDKGLVYVQGTKTNQGRCLPLSEPVEARLKDLQARRLLSETRDPDGIVFMNAEGRRLDPKHVSSRLRELCVKAGIPPISPHKLRHTAATLALAETGDLHGVQKMLGHSQVSLTSDLYGHATAETLWPISNAIEKAMRPT